MSMLATVQNENTQHLDFLFPNWRAWVREMLWKELEKLEAIDGEQAIYTFRFTVWKIPVSFTFRVKHLRAVVGAVIGEQP